MTQVFECECGRRFHFEKALKAHCNFRHHKPKAAKAAAQPETIVPDIQEELEKALEPEPVTVKKTRKPRAKKTVEKEQA